MIQYLLDTNICIYYIKGLYNLDSKFREVGPEFCFISEITLAELKFGVANSNAVKRNQLALDNFLSGIQLLPILPALDIYAKEKTRLRSEGKIIDDFDLLIASTAVAFDLTLVTNNTRHFINIEDLKVVDWTNSK